MKSPLPVLSRCFPAMSGIILAATLSGCSTDIMRGYVGRSPEDVMARYGPPYDVRDLPDGRRAYQWLETEMTTSGGTETTIIDKRGRARARTEFSPTTTEEKRCFYTMYAHRTPAGWRIDDFAKPEFGC